MTSAWMAAPSVPAHSVSARSVLQILRVCAVQPGESSSRRAVGVTLHAPPFGPCESRHHPPCRWHAACPRVRSCRFCAIQAWYMEKRRCNLGRFGQESARARSIPQLCPRARDLRDRAATTGSDDPTAASVREGDRAWSLTLMHFLVSWPPAVTLPEPQPRCLQPVGLDRNNYPVQQWGLCGVPRSKAWPSEGHVKVAKPARSQTPPQHPAHGIPSTWGARGPPTAVLSLAGGSSPLTWRRAGALLAAPAGIGSFLNGRRAAPPALPAPNPQLPHVPSR